MPVRSWSTAAFAAALVSSSGCFKSYAVVSFWPVEPAVAEATAVAMGPLPVAAVRTVAVRAPSGCSGASAGDAGGSGVALRTRAILASRCEIWLSELEKALATRFTVVGWRELAQAERAGRLSAARDAGVDLVLAVTELQTEPLLASAADASAVRLTRATPYGEPAAGEPVSPKEEAAIRRVVAARYADGALVGVRGVVEITATSAAGGEPIWTYRGQVSDELSGALEPRMLLRGRAASWRPVLPRGWRPQETTGAAPAAPAEDPVRARLREIAAAVAADVIAAFPTAG